MDMKYLKLFEEASESLPDVVRLAKLGLAQLKVLKWKIGRSREYYDLEPVKEIQYIIYPHWPNTHTDNDEYDLHSDYETLINGYDPDSESDRDLVRQMVHKAARYWEVDWIYDMQNKTWEKPFYS